MQLRNTICDRLAVKRCDRKPLGAPGAPVQAVAGKYFRRAAGYRYDPPEYSGERTPVAMPSAMSRSSSGLVA